MDQRPEVTLVVTTRNSGSTLEACLRSINQQSLPNIQLVVVDNDSQDDTLNIARRYAQSVHQMGPERSAQRNFGLRVALAEFVVFIDSDMVLEPNVAEEVVKAFRGDEQCAAVVIPEESFGSTFFARARAWERALYKQNPNIEAARGFRTSLLQLAGGWNESLTGPEDWELTDRFRASRAHFSRTEARIWHNEGSLTLKKAFKRKRHYAPSMRTYLRAKGKGRRSVLGRFPAKKTLRATGSSPLLALGALLLKTVDAAGYAVGLSRWNSGANPYS